MTNDDEGEMGGGMLPSKNDDVIYEQPLVSRLLLQINKYKRLFERGAEEEEIATLEGGRPRGDFFLSGRGDQEKMQA